MIHTHHTSRWLVVGAIATIISLVLVLAPVLSGARQASGASLPAAGDFVSPARSEPALADKVSGGAGADASVVRVGTGETTLTYCHEDGIPETLVVLEPSPLPVTPVPVVVYIHGGGWMGGDATVPPGSMVGDVSKSIVARGWVFVSINYRLAPRFPWPAQIDDAKCAIRFLHANASSLHIEPRHIGTVGDSAGGQLVALLGSAGPTAGFDVGQYSADSSAVQAVVDLYGPADLTTVDWSRSPLMQAVAPHVFGTTFGPGPSNGATSKVLEAASPVTYVRRGDPPFLIMQGAQDTVVPPTQSEELARRLALVGDAPSFVMVPGAGHGWTQWPAGPPVPAESQLAAEATSFLFGHLGGG